MGTHKFILLGRLGNDFELRTAKSGKEFATSSIAVETKYNGESRTSWYKLVAFGRQAGVLAQYTKKGNPLYVEGIPTAEAWIPQGADTPKARVSVIVQDFQLLGDTKYAQDDSPLPPGNEYDQQQWGLD